MAGANKIDSNVTGLRIAEEETLAVLPTLPDWYDLEPNSYNDFGGNLTLVARNPISAKRKRKKGVITDLDASGGFNQDLTFTNLTHLVPGIFLSDRRTRFALNADLTELFHITGVTAADDQMATNSDVSAVVGVGDIFFCTGFTEGGNNGLKVVQSVSAAGIVFEDGLVDETPPVTAQIRLVGFEFVADSVNVTNTLGSLPVLDTGAKVAADFNLQPGDFVFIGGDTATTAFVDPANNGFCRVAEVGANNLTFDKTGGGANGTTEMVDETLAGGETVQLFFGEVVVDEDSDAPGFDCKSYTIERRLGSPDTINFPNAVQSEALRGAVVNDVAVNISQADKINMDFTFIATDNAQFDGLTNAQRGEGVDEVPLSTIGTVIDIEEATAYNTSSDFSRIRLATVRPDNNAAPDPLFAFVTELTINLGNNASPNKAVSRLGAFDVTTGTFTVGGNITAYFADINAVKAVRNNADVTLDIAIVKDFGTGVEKRKAGIVIDIPLIALGDGRLNVAQDEPITLPLQTDAAEYEPFGITASWQEFYYLPNAADL